MNAPNKKDEYVAVLKNKLDKWSAEIDVLEARTRKASADARVQAEQQLLRLKRKRADARERLVEIQSAAGEAWETLVEGADRVWSDLEEIFQQTQEAISRDTPKNS